jgi:hypothetical protein
MGYLQNGEELPMNMVRSRVVLCGSITSLLHGAEERPLTKANLLKQKLQYVNSLLSIWIEAGGLGCRQASANWPRWTGPQLDEQAYKTIDWIIVGKSGDSDAVVIEAAPLD